MQCLWSFILQFTLIQSVLSLLPSSIKLCSKEDLDFESCLMDVLNSIKPQLSSGDFGDGMTVESLEPLYTASLPIDTTELKINMSESVIQGSSGFRVTSVTSDLDNLQFDIGLMTSVLNFHAKYSLHQHFKTLKVFVKAVGDISGIFKKVRSKLRIKFKMEDEFVKLDKIHFKMRIEDAQFNIESLIVKDDVTGDDTNRVLLKEIANMFINADPKFILRKVEPNLETAFVDYLTKTIESLFENVKIDDFFRI